jgi:ferredoxin-NADP reductase
MILRFERREELAPTIWHYYFRPERPLDFVAGQYAEFHLLADFDDPRGRSRTFTLTSLPEDELVSFVVKCTEPLSPYKQHLVALQPGDAVRIGDAMGDLILPKLPTQPLVFVAGGIGMASFASMLTLLSRRQEQREIYLFYALKSRRERLYRELTASYPLALEQLIYAPNRLAAQEIVSTTPPSALIYLSGSQRFVEGLRVDLAALGVPHEQIVFDYFDGYAEL